MNVIGNVDRMRPGRKETLIAPHMTFKRRE